MPRRSPQSAEEAQAWLAAIVIGSDDAIIGKTLDGIITSWNPAAHRIYGYSAREIVGRTVFLLAPDDRRNEIKRILERIKRGESITHFETVRRRKDGRLINVSLTVSPLRGETGKIVGASTIARDITDAKRAEERFRLAVEAAPNAMLMVGADGRVILVNAQTERLFGYTREELVGKTIEALVPQRFRGRHVKDRQDYFAKPTTRSMGAGRDLFGVRKDGTEVAVEIGLNPIETPEGRVVLASIIDITERRALEKRLAHSEVLASIGGMVAVVAHEIRNPLGSIVMAARALMRGDVAVQDQTQIMSVLKSESERLNGTLTDFLQLAKPRELRLERGDLNAVVAEALKAVRTDTELVGKAEVAHKLDKRLPPLVFDSGQLRQVLWNLIRNAFQALGGRGRLDVRTETRPGQAAIVIQDTGPGIPAAQLEKIFMPFFTTKSKGTGLGLSIARNIILAHGGDIQVQSEPGQGTRFTIVLPIVG